MLRKNPSLDMVQGHDKDYNVWIVSRSYQICFVFKHQVIFYIRPYSYNSSCHSCSENQNLFEFLDFWTGLPMYTVAHFWPNFLDVELGKFHYILKTDKTSKTICPVWYSYQTSISDAGIWVLLTLLVLS